MIQETMEQFVENVKEHHSKWDDYVSLHNDENGFVDGIGVCYISEKWFNYDGISFRYEDNCFLFYTDDPYYIIEVNCVHDERLVHYMDYKPSELVDIIKQTHMNREIYRKRALMSYKFALNTLIAKYDLVLSNISTLPIYYDYINAKGESQIVQITIRCKPGEKFYHIDIRDYRYINTKDGSEFFYSINITDEFRTEMLLEGFKKKFYE